MSFILHYFLARTFDFINERSACSKFFRCKRKRVDSAVEGRKVYAQRKSTVEPVSRPTIYKYIDMAIAAGPEDVFTKMPHSLKRSDDITEKA